MEGSAVRASRRARTTLQAWLEDAAFEEVRGLARLQADERVSWSAFWARVAALGAELE